MKRIFIYAIIAVMSFTAAAKDHSFLHIYQTNGAINTGKLSEVDNILFIPTADSDTLFNQMVVSRNGNQQTFDMDSVEKCVVGTNVPTIYIDINDNAEVLQKDLFLDARIRIESYGAFDDLDECDVQIRGRGNSTWGMEKKPYRIKFSKKCSLFGLKKAKNYVLLANMIDCTLMRNAVTFKMAQLLGMPFTNNAIPVNLVINGTYRGSYLVSEKLGINGASVDIDETEGILFELDSNYDEDYKFHSSKFNLPVMVKDPDFAELYEDDPTYLTPEENLNKWRRQFEEMEAALSEDGTSSDLFAKKMDLNSMVNYLMVFNFACNQEINHPKSVYMYKENEDDLFHMGPVWDFDYAYTFYNYAENETANRYMLYWSGIGTSFFTAVCKLPEFRELYEKRWNEFKTDLYPQLLEYIDEYAKNIEVSASQNGELWPSGDYVNGSYHLTGTESFARNVAAFKTWIQKRMEFLDSADNWGLYMNH